MSAVNMIQDFYRSTAVAFRITEQIGPFLASYHSESINCWLNYAIPDNDVGPTDSDVLALIDAYKRHDRAPRLEYLPDCAPAVRMVLERGGFIVEAELPIMICTANELVPVSDPDGIEFVVATDRSGVVTALEVQCEAFGDPPPDSATIERQLRNANAGLIYLLAEDKVTREPAGAGMDIPPIDGVTEVAGIAVKEKFRKKGIAASLTYRVSKLALGRGVKTIFLSPASDEGERIYGRVGFRAVSEVIHMSLPKDRSG